MIVIDSEQMLVTNVPGGPAGCMNSPCTITVTRAYNNTTEAGHAINATVFKLVPDTTLQVTNTSGSAEVAVNDVILVDSEQMLVTGVAGGGTNLYNLTVTRAYGGTGEGTHSNGATVQKVASDTKIVIAWTGGGATPVKSGDTIRSTGSR